MRLSLRLLSKKIAVNRMDYQIKINKKLLWDYQITEEDLKNEKILIFYISRVLNNGNLIDVKEIPPSLIIKYIDMLHLSKRVRQFWEWYLRIN
jgi:hypothetical protein